MQPQEFPKIFEILTGNPPFPWQIALYNKFIAGEFPSSANIPTGLGKTSIVVIWLIALAQHPYRVPRRLVYVVNRRTVVDQTTTEVVKLREQLIKHPDLATVAGQLRSLGAIPVSEAAPLAISTLRGKFADNREWSVDPARPAVVIGTVDMIGSGLLFNRYTAGFKLRPHHAALLAQDALLVHDEAHLEPAFQNLLEAIVAEQAHANDPRKLHVIALTATSRHANPPERPIFGLTADDKKSCIEDGIEKNVVLQRFHAIKQLRLIGVAAEKDVRVEIVRLALEKKDTGRAILVFVRSVEAAEKIAVELSKNKSVGVEKIATLTGTLRGKERDCLVKFNAVFQRFLAPSYRSEEIEFATGTVYLVATSAGEVGVNLSAADLVCDLSTYESMAQRFGRVNRFGENSDSTIAIVHAEDMQAKYDESLTKAKNAPKDAAKKIKAYETKNKVTLSLLQTLELLRSLAALNHGVGDACPAALDALSATDRAAAFSPLPKMRVATAVQFDVWALTSIREPLAARPPIAPYLHGEAGWEPPETHVAWRDEAEWITGDLLKAYPPEGLLEDFPLRPRELLRDTSGRIFDRLVEIAESLSKSELNQLNGWLVIEESKVESFPLRNLLADDTSEASDADDDDSEGNEDEGNDTSGDAKAAKDAAKRRKDRIVARLADRTLILPPSFGGLSRQGFLAATDAGNAVNRDHLDVSTDSDRKREWRDTPEIPTDLSTGFRLVRVIDSQLGSEDSFDAESSSEAGDPADSDATPSRGRYWLWLETKKAVDAERRYSSNSGQPETLAAHTGAVVGHARAIAEKALASPIGSSRGDTPDLGCCLVLAARCHDLGKNRRQWQLGIGNFNFDSKNPETIFAKSGGKLRPRLLAEHYRHEFGSLADITTAARAEASIAAEFSRLSDLERDIVLHLVAAHHGRARPHFPADEIFDYLSGSPRQSVTLATEIPRRFARLQRHFGRWGLAWLESLLRAADYAASSGIAPQNGAETAISSQTIRETPRESSEAHAPQPAAEISLHLNPANPGHYFACCGLLELAAALAPDARAWFAEDGATFHIAATGFPLKELLEKITAAEIVAAGEEANTETRNEEEEEGDGENEEEASTPPLNIGNPFGLRLDWWNTATANISALKVWAGSMDVLSIARSMSYTIAQTLSSARAVENILFETCVAYDPSKVENNKKKYESTYEKAAQKAEEKRTEALNKAEAIKSGEKLEKEKSKIASRFKEDLLKAKSKRDSADPLKDAKKEPFYFDANRGPNAHSRDVGFATNDLKWETLAAPAVELLTLVGLQRATPAPVPKMPRNFDYHLWTRPLPVSLLPAAVNGLLPDSSPATFRFESWFRTGQRKHKAFIAARTIPAR